MNPFEKPEVKFVIPLEGTAFEFSTKSPAFNPDYTDLASVQNSLADLRQIRLRLIRGLSIVKKDLATNKRNYNAWLAQTRSNLRPDGKSFKNLDEAQDAVYLHNADMIMQHEGSIEKSRAIRDELQDLLDMVKDVMYSYTKILEVTSR